MRGRPVAEETGALVELSSGNGEFVARGFVDHDHAIAVRVVSRRRDEKVAPGQGAIAARFARAQLARRALLAGDPTRTAQRLFSGDSEGLPGVTVDRFAEFIVVQWLSAGALPWRDELFEAIRAHANPHAIYEQRRIRPLAGQAPPEPASLAWGEAAPLEVIIEEEVGGKMGRFAVDVTAPLGVGFFADMRLGHAAVAARAAGRRVANLFSYTGAFSVHALLAGATELVAVDTAAKVHARARRNLELSGIEPGRMEQVTEDAQKALERWADRGRSFDLVICDPPTFSHGQSAGESFSVARDLAQVVGAATRVLAPGGLLAVATNSVKIAAVDFDRAVAEGATLAGTELRLIERVGLPADFPVAPGFPEGNYLKFALAHKA